MSEKNSLPFLQKEGDTPNLRMIQKINKKWIRVNQNHMTMQRIRKRSKLEKVLI